MKLSPIAILEIICLYCSVAFQLYKMLNGYLLKFLIQALVTYVKKFPYGYIITFPLMNDKYLNFILVYSQQIFSFKLQNIAAYQQQFKT